MRWRVPLLLLALVVIPAVIAIQGVTICGVNYACGAASPGICPQTYADATAPGGQLCQTCDPDCGGRCTCGAADVGQSCQSSFITPATGGRYHCAGAPIGTCMDCGVNRMWDGSACVVVDFLCGAASVGSACAGVAVSYESLQYSCNGPGNTGTCIDCGAGNICRSMTSDPDGPLQTVPAACGLALTCDGGAENCLSCEADCGVCQMPAVTLFTATASSSTPSFAAVLNLQGTVAPELTGTYAIDANKDGDFTDPGESSSSTPFAAQVTGLAGGTHTFNARVTDSLVRSSDGLAVITFNDWPPVIRDPTGVSAPTITTTAYCDRVETRFQFRVTDEKPGAVARIVYGDGTPDMLSAPCPGTFCIYDQTHSYTTGAASYAASITGTEAPPDTQSSSFATTIDGTRLITVGTDTGALTQTGQACECWNSNSCSDTIAGNTYCFAMNSCRADGEMCAGATSPPTFVDRDTSETVCEALTPTCAQYTWATTGHPGWSTSSQSCIGDDRDEYPSTYLPTYNTIFSGNVSSCSSPAPTCFTMAGSQWGCNGGVESSALPGNLCRNNRDDDCDGAADGADDDCGAIFRGTITFNTRWDRTGEYLPAPATSDVRVRIGSKYAFTGNCADLASIPVQQQSLLCPTGATTNTVGTISYYVTVQPQNTVLTFSAFGFESYVYNTRTTPVSGQTYTIDGLLIPTFCNDDCTNSQGYCDQGCIGVGLCQPTPQETETIEACHPTGAAYGLKPGQEVILDYNKDTEEVNVGICCTVPAAARSAPPSAVTNNPAFGNIDTLVRYTSTVIINGRPYKLVINTWGS